MRTTQAKNCGLVLGNSYTEVSRKHCEFRLSPPARGQKERVVEVIDMGSMNGTRATLASI